MVQKLSVARRRGRGGGQYKMADTLLKSCNSGFQHECKCVHVGVRELSRLGAEHIS
jgi:hypothetical protein